jgi:hypothetical protein
MTFLIFISILGAIAVVAVSVVAFVDRKDLFSKQDGLA